MRAATYQDLGDTFQAIAWRARAALSPEARERSAFEAMADWCASGYQRAFAGIGLGDLFGRSRGRA